MIPRRLVEVCQGLLAREEVNPERVAQDRRPRESGQLHSFFGAMASSLWIVPALSALHSLGGNALGGVLLAHIIDNIVSRIQNTIFSPKECWQYMAVRTI